MRVIVKIGFLFCLMFGSFYSQSQDKVKFGYFNKNHKIEVKKIPVKDTITPKENNLFFKSPKSNDTINIAVLLPFYTKLNDTLVKNWSIEGKDINQIYFKSKLSLKLLEGILLATDSLSNRGICVRLSVFDTENNKNVVNKLLHSDTLNSVNIIFGPLYSSNFKVVSQFFKFDKKKTFINPLSSHVDLLRRNPNVYSLTPADKIIRDSISSFVIRKRDKKNIVIFSLANESKNSDYIKLKINKQLIPVNYKMFSSIKDITSESLSAELNSDTSIVIIPSNNKSLVTKIIALLGTIDNPMTVIGMESCSSFNELNTETLMKLNVHLPSTYNLELKENVKLQRKFEKIYFHKMDKFSIISYQSIIHFCSTDSHFNFKNFVKGNGFVNTNIQFLYYSDFKLMSVN